MKAIFSLFCAVGLVASAGCAVDTVPDAPTDAVPALGWSDTELRADAQLEVDVGGEVSEPDEQGAGDGSGPNEEPDPYPWRRSYHPGPSDPCPGDDIGEDGSRKRRSLRGK